jgi:hypothetical protein
MGGRLTRRSGGSRFDQLMRALERPDMLVAVAVEGLNARGERSVTVQVSFAKGTDKRYHISREDLGNKANLRALRQQLDKTGIAPFQTPLFDMLD